MTEKGDLELTEVAEGDGLCCTNDKRVVLRKVYMHKLSLTLCTMQRVDFPRQPRIW